MNVGSFPGITLDEFPGSAGFESKSGLPSTVLNNSKLFKFSISSGICPER
jgi:hypothetical protein